MNKQFFEKQLADLLRSNKDRKLKLALRAGYTTVESYKKALEDAIGDSPEENVESNAEDAMVAKKPIIHNVTILDNSGSMSGTKFNNAYAGIKNEIKKLKNINNVEYKISFAHFDYINGCHQSIISNFDERIDNFEIPNIGANTGTPLYDTIILVAEKLLDNKNSDQKVLLQIFTDGADMHSMNSANKASLMIEALKEIGVTVTFIGTEYDVERIINKLKISESDTLSHDNTGQGVMNAFKTRSAATASYSAKVIKGEDVSTGFYKSFK